MFCYKCGTQVPDDACLCSNCGTSLSFFSNSNYTDPQSLQDNITESLECYDEDDNELSFNWGLYSLINCGIVVAPTYLKLSYTIPASNVTIYYSDIVNVTKKRDGTAFRTTITYKVNNKMKEKNSLEKMTTIIMVLQIF